jgi:phage-related protein
MSEDLFYNRDRNISGIIAPENLSELSLNPVYGSRVEFTSKLVSYETDDCYYNTIPNSLNNLTASYKLRYDVNEQNCTELANFFESKEGNQSFIFNPDNSGIYKSTQGFCENYAINYINNNHYEFAVDIMVDQAPSILNWKSSSYLNFDNLKTVSNPFNSINVKWKDYNNGWSRFKVWSLGASYKKYDIIFDDINTNKLNNWFYCTEDNIGTALNKPNGINTLWTQEFFFKPNIGIQNEVKMQVQTLNFKNSFPLRIKTKNNIAKIDINYKFTDIDDRQLTCMLHFLENKYGYRRFKNQIATVYNRPKVFYCPQWSHTWKYKNSHDLDVSFIEDPLGIIPENT